MMFMDSAIQPTIINLQHVIKFEIDFVEYSNAEDGVPLYNVIAYLKDGYEVAMFTGEYDKCYEWLAQFI